MPGVSEEFFNAAERMSFGSYLFKCGAITRQQLEESLQAQVLFGDRLGTNLVELGHLELDELARYLAEYTAVSSAPVVQLAAPDSAALRIVPLELARRFSALPFALHAGGVDVVMLEPRNQAHLMRLSEAAGRPVCAFSAPEILLYALLERHLDIPLSSRFARLATGLPERRSKKRTRHPGPKAAQRVVPTPLADGEELIDEASFAKLHSELVEGPNRPLKPLGPVIDPEVEQLASVAVDTVRSDARRADSAASSGPADLARLEGELACAAHRDEIVRLALRLAHSFAHRAALFLVHDGAVVGFRAGDSPLQLLGAGVVIPLEAKSRFAQVATARTAFRGEAPRTGLDAHVLQALGRGDVREWMLIPICIGERVVHVLYADNGADALADTAMAALKALGSCVSQAYERLILAAKQAGGVAP